MFWIDQTCSPWRRRESLKKLNVISKEASIVISRFAFATATTCYACKVTFRILTLHASSNGKKVPLLEMCSAINLQ